MKNSGLDTLTPLCRGQVKDNTLILIGATLLRTRQGLLTCLDAVPHFVFSETGRANLCSRFHLSDDELTAALLAYPNQEGTTPLPTPIATSAPAVRLQDSSYTHLLRSAPPNSFPAVVPRVLPGFPRPEAGETYYAVTALFSGEPSQTKEQLLRRLSGSWPGPAADNFAVILQAGCIEQVLPNRYVLPRRGGPSADMQQKLYGAQYRQASLATLPTISQQSAA